MEPEAKYTLVGGAMLLLLALVAGAIYWLATSGQGKDVRTYTIYFSHQSLEGLQVRSDVRMRGIRVGAVTAFSFSPTKPGTVQVVIGIDPGTPVKQSTQAVVDRNLVTGVATIRLQNLSEDSPPLVEAAPGEDHAVIAEGASQLQQFSDTVSKLAQRADETLTRVNATLSPENIAAIGKTLDNIRIASDDAAGVVKRLDQTLVSIGRSADRIDSVAASAGADVHRLADRYDTLGAETTQGIREVSSAVHQLGIDLSAVSQRTESLAIDSDVEIRLTAQQLRSSTEALGVAARRFRDPRATLFGPAEGSLGPGEKRQ
jgi:phospholipid/cholesterol/gamma-HCH transport system substrate-binding protein